MKNCRIQDISRVSLVILLYINCIMLFFANSNINFLIKISHSTSYIPFLVIGIVVFITLYKGNISTSYFVISIYLILAIITIFIEPSIQKIIIRGVAYFCINIFCIAYLFSQNNNLEKLFISIRNIVPFATFCALIHIFFFKSENIYDMAWTNATIFPTLICISDLLLCKNRYAINSVCITILVLSNFLHGSRGFFLCCFCEILLILFFIRIKQKILILSITTIIIVCCGIYFNQLPYYLSQKYPELRIIRLITIGKLYYPAGRDRIYNKLFDEIMNHPFKFRGLYTDRIYLVNYLEGNTTGTISEKDMIWGSYAHNVVLEILFQFGVLGFLFIIYTLIFFIKLTIHIRKTNNYYLKSLYIAIVSFAFGQLMISSSYLISQSSGLLLGFVIFITSKYRKYINY